jgi:hypothetical protein
MTVKLKVIINFTLIFLILFSFSFSATSAYPQQIKAGWQRTIGLNDRNETGQSIQITSDGGYIIAAVAYSSQTGADIYLIKIDSSGQQQWSRIIGGNGDDWVNSVQQTTDSGYILGGYTTSSGAGGKDFFLVKTNASGNVQWNATFGGSNDDVAYSVQQTTDGGYILGGYTSSFGSGFTDMYLVKTNSSGGLQWEKTIGGANYDWCFSLQQTTDGGYILAGGTGYYLYRIGGVYLVKTDPSGNVIWSRTFRNPAYSEYATSVQQTTDGGYILAGYSNPYSLNGDIYLIKIDSSGQQQWSRIIGGNGDDTANSVMQTTDGGFLITGSTTSYGAGGTDVFLVETNSSGFTTATQTFGGPENDWGNDAKQNSDGSCIIVGTTESFSSGPTPQDVYLIKTNAFIDVTPPAITLLAPQSGLIINEQRPTIGASYSDQSSGINVTSVQVTIDSLVVTAIANISTSEFSYVPPSNLSEGSHSVFLSVSDYAGNTATSRWNFTIDITKPVISSLIPISGSYTSNTRPTISTSYSDQWGINLSSVQMTLDSLDVTSQAIISPSGILLVPSSLSDGAHAIILSIVDNAGNSAISNWSFMVDSTPPSVMIYSPINSTTLNVLGSTQVQIQASCSDNIGLNFSLFKLIIDGVDVTSQAAVTTTGIHYTATFDAGNHIVTFSISDNAGNVATSSVSFSIVNLVPYIILIVVVAIILAVIAVFLLRRSSRRHEIPTPQEPTQEATTTPPPSPPAPEEKETTARPVTVMLKEEKIEAPSLLPREEKPILLPEKLITTPEEQPPHTEPSTEITAELSPKESPVPLLDSTSSAPTSLSIYCYYCGSENSRAAIYCQNCGKKLIRPMKSS